MQSKDDSLGMVYVRSGTQHPENAPHRDLLSEKWVSSSGSCSVLPLQTVCVLVFNVEFMPTSDAKKYSVSTKEGLERREGIHQACVSVFRIVLRPQAHCSFHVCT